MTIALDTNILVSLINRADPLNEAVGRVLDSLSEERLVVCGAVYAELLAFRRRTESFVDVFLSETRIDIDWTVGESIWRVAGHTFSKYADRRRKAKTGHPRRILTDFLIGAHAIENSYPLFTLDEGHYRTAFPKLKLIRV